MTTAEKTIITVEASINAPITTVWDLWTDPKHITQWNHASDDWHSPSAENDLREGGSFTSRMEAKDGSMGFDFTGTYNKVVPYQEIAYVMEDGRKVHISFVSEENQTKVTETFEAEQSFPVDMQQQGWQAILNNFKKYAETSQR